MKYFYLSRRNVFTNNMKKSPLNQVHFLCFNRVDRIKIGLKISLGVLSPDFS